MGKGSLAVVESYYSINSVNQVNPTKTCRSLDLLSCVNQHQFVIGKVLLLPPYYDDAEKIKETYRCLSTLTMLRLLATLTSTTQATLTDDLVTQVQKVTDITKSIEESL